MNRASDIAKIIGCTKSNVYYLLRKGHIKKTYTDDGWIVTDEAVQEYLKSRKPKRLTLQKGKQIGYWTVLEPRIYGSDR